MRRAKPISADFLIDEREDGTSIRGYAAVFYDGSDDGTEYQLGDNLFERIAPGAFDRALSESDDVRALFNHDPNYILGRSSAGSLRLSVDDRGLLYEIDLDMSDPDSTRVLRKVERGDVSGSSFAFTIDDQEIVQDEGRNIREIRSVSLYDVGPVTFPAYESASSGVRMEDVTECRSAVESWKHKKEEQVRAEHDRLRLSLIIESEL